MTMLHETDLVFGVILLLAFVAVVLAFLTRKRKGSPKVYTYKPGIPEQPDPSPWWCRSSNETTPS
jgi:hypothetical protein